MITEIIYVENMAKQVQRATAEEREIPISLSRFRN